MPFKIYFFLGGGGEKEARDVKVLIMPTERAACARPGQARRAPEGTTAVADSPLISIDNTHTHTHKGERQREEPLAVLNRIRLSLVRSGEQAAGVRMGGITEPPGLPPCPLAALPTGGGGRASSSPLFPPSLLEHLCARWIEGISPGNRKLGEEEC